MYFCQIPPTLHQNLACAVSTAKVGKIRLPSALNSVTFCLNRHLCFKQEVLSNRIPCWTGVPAWTDAPGVSQNNLQLILQVHLNLQNRKIPAPVDHCKFHQGLDFLPILETTARDGVDKNGAGNQIHFTAQCIHILSFQVSIVLKQIC